MAYKAKVKLENGEHWFLLPYAAKLLGTTQAKMKARAVADEFTWQPDKHGLPLWFKGTEITDARVAFQSAVKRPDDIGKPRAKTPAQLEAQWARESAINKERARSGLSQSMHLRLTLPHEKDDG